MGCERSRKSFIETKIICQHYLSHADVTKRAVTLYICQANSCLSLLFTLISYDCLLLFLLLEGIKLSGSDSSVLMPQNYNGALSLFVSGH